MTQIEAPASRYKKQNFILWAIVLIGLAVWFAHDGYRNQEFIKKHKLEDGSPDATLKFNKYAPPFMIFGGLVMGAMALVTGRKKLIADDQSLQFSDQTIPYNQIEKVDKTHFDKKGYFVLTWKKDDGSETDIKLSDREYDNMPAVLDRIIEKIS